MGQKPKGPAGDFARNVITVLEDARIEAGMTKAQLIEASEMPANSYHTRMRGERPFDLNDIERLAHALGCDPFVILRRAADGTTIGAPLAPVTPIGRASVVPLHEDDLEYKQPPATPRAAKRGTRKADAEPHAE